MAFLIYGYDKRYKPGLMGVVSATRSQAYMGKLTRRVKVYDVLETDPAKKLLFDCESASEASRLTGVNGVARYIKTKGRCHTNSLNKVLAFR